MVCNRFLEVAELPGVSERKEIDDIASPIKVCHAFIFFSVRFAGGTSDLMYKICKAQVKSGLQPVVYTGDYQFDAELASMLSGVVFRVTRSWLDRMGYSIMPSLISLAHRDIQAFDVVHMHVFRTFQNLVLYHYCRKYGVPYIIDAHGAVPYYRHKRVLKWLFDLIWGRRMLRNAAKLIAETKVGVDEYKAIDPEIDDERLTVLSPPFDTDEFADLPERGLFRREYGIKEKDVIMFLGRVHQIKGNDFLIKGFTELMKRRKSCRLLIVGSDDGHKDECEALAANLGVSDSVTFVGFLDSEKKVSALVDADIVAQMSRQEQGAWAPFEAVLCGTPIIVTSHTGAGEDVKRVDAGYLVDFDDVQGLAECMEWILTHKDEARAKTVRAKAFIEQNLSLNQRVHEYTKLYQDSIAEAKTNSV